MSNTKNFFRASAEDFKKIPGSPIAYWMSDKVTEAFTTCRTLSDVAKPRQGLATSDNNRFLKLWHEVSRRCIGMGLKGRDEALSSRCKWFPCQKGGTFRKWYGNHEYVVNWWNDGEELLAYAAQLYKSPTRTIKNIQYYFKEGISWSTISSGTFSMRYSPWGFISETKGAICFADKQSDLLWILGFTNTSLVNKFLAAISPTLDYHEGPVGRLPVPWTLPAVDEIIIGVQKCVHICRIDWDSYETSWDFKSNPLVAIQQNPVEESGQGVVSSGQKSKLPTAHCLLPNLYAQLRKEWAERCEEMRQLEIENNRIFIEAYGLQDELTPDVPWNEITLTCNPWYRYGETAPNGGSNEFPIDAELESRLKGDTVKELISYAVGCMMGRYSIDKPGLILADQGATLQDFLAKVPSPSYGVDEDGIIPILDNDWFADDIVTRFKEFVKVVFGEEHYFENMAWIEDALGKDIRSYFTKDFYKDHLQRYQNRPIYWLFQSPKGAFRALVYMHRYKPDMVGGVLGYLRSLQTKIDNQLDVAMQIGMDESKSASERVRANKDAVRFAKAKKELDEYERNVLYPLSTERIEIDLDDGVKVNYRKFGSALRKVAALEAKGE